ncbi:MAG: dihydroorotase, partial [Rhodobacteraceae bacterium]
MTSLLLSNALLIDPEADTPVPGWLRIADGAIAATGHGEAQAAEGEEVVDCRGKCLAPGIVDIGVKVCEPGERHKESFRSAGLAAAAGGVTTMVTRPDTSPAIDSPEVLEFVTRRAKEVSPVHVLPMAALTKGR